MSPCERAFGRLKLGIAAVVAAASLLGCDRGPELASVEGVVTYEGEPLRFGSVMFQGPQGPPATGKIVDGAFNLAVRGYGDGAMLGVNRVRVSCYEAQSPDYRASSEAELSLGRSLIPIKYTNPRTSPLSVTVSPGTNRVTLDLSDN